MKSYLLKNYFLYHIRPTQTKRRKRKRRRRSPSNLAQDHYINKNKKNLLDPIPLETLLPCPLPRPSNPRKEKDLHKQQALAHSTSFPMKLYLLEVMDGHNGRGVCDDERDILSVSPTDRPTDRPTRRDEATHYSSSPTDRLSSRYLNTTKRSVTAA